MPLELNNATFKAFTDFASNVKGRTIAALEDKVDIKSDIKTEGPLNGRTIAPSSNHDFIGNVGRRARKQEANNAVRELFRQSIIDMFSGEALIPDSVKIAMKLEDYGKGKPLSARRIMAVKVAIDAVKEDMKPITIDEATAQKMLKESEISMGGSLDDYNGANKLATEWLMKYGNGMPAKTARLLSNFIVNTILNHEDTNISLDEERIKNVAEDMRTWDEFIFGDKRLEEIGKEFMNRQNNYIKEKINDSKEFLPSNPDVFKQVEADADRFDWTINGQKLAIGTDKQTVINAFCDAVKNPNARKAISINFNQGFQSDLVELLFKSIDPTKEINLSQLPNANIFVSHDISKDGFPITKTVGSMFDLKISEDGKTATVTVTSVQDLTISQSDDKYKIGKANIAIQSTYDLTKELPEITNITFSQTFMPDQTIKSA